MGGKPAYDAYIKAFMTSAKIAKGTIYVQDVNNINEIFNGRRRYNQDAWNTKLLKTDVIQNTLFIM